MSDKIKTIDLLDIAKSGSIGPIQIGAKLSDFANQIGPPCRWADFSDPKRLSCFMVFGDVEVGFEGRKNDLIVTWAKFWMHSFERRRLSFAVDENGQNTFISNPFTSKFPSFDEVKRELRSQEVGFTDKFLEYVGGDTTAVMNFGNHLKFYYTEKRNPKLMLVELTDNSIKAT